MKQILACALLLFRSAASLADRARLVLLACAALVSLSPASRADENYFGYVYGTETLPRGECEAYQWITGRFNKTAGQYRAFDFNTEIEYGFTNRFQGSLYLNSSHHRVRNVPGFADVNRTDFQGVATELKYDLRDPARDGYGLAFYLEPGWSRIAKVSGEKTTEYELETKIIFQKNFLGDTVVYAANFSLESERERPDGEWENNLQMEFSHGVTTRLASHWFLGLENRWQTEFPFARLNHEKFLAVFLGPTLHYEAKEWWFSFTVLPQIYGWPGDGRNLALNEHERLEVRLKTGFDF